ncbi:MAG: hypothetical protein ACOY3D_02725 [Candidatus Omnitrophota bacterium]
MRIFIPLILSLGLFVLVAADSLSRYAYGRFEASGSVDEELTFIKLRRSLTDTTITSAEAAKSRFGIAEYYFRNNAFLDAFRAFKEYADKYPPEVSTLLARVYLYKIADLKKDTETAQTLKKDIFSESFVLLFSKYKTLKYRSAFGNDYEVHYYLDRIKIFLNGEVFAELTP